MMAEGKRAEHGPRRDRSAHAASSTVVYEIGELIRSLVPSEDRKLLLHILALSAFQAKKSNSKAGAVGSATMYLTCCPANAAELLAASFTYLESW